jgi:hypothetical protein
MTRWSKRDLTGRVLQSMVERDGDEWEVISLPAILPTGKPLWPEFWSYDELEKLRNELPISKWSAQYQQDPSSEEGDFKEYINPDSLEVIANAYLEPSLETAKPGEHFQFIRKGYFYPDTDSTEEKLVFNRTVTLKDAWSKEQQKE